MKYFFDIIKSAYRLSLNDTMSQVSQVSQVSVTPVIDFISIIFRGNCIDSWVSTYFLYIYHKYVYKNSNIKLYPVAENQTNTWPSLSQLSSTYVMIVSLTVPNEWKEFFIKIEHIQEVWAINHIDTSVHFKNGQFNIVPNTIESSVSLRLFPILFSDDIPSWVHTIDRISRWDNPTKYDRSLRESLHLLALMPYRHPDGLQTEAINAMDKFIIDIDIPSSHDKILSDGSARLQYKDYHLGTILFKNASGGVQYTINNNHLIHWRLAREWFGKRIFVFNNTNQVIDSTEAFHLVILHYPSVDIFINYRKKNNSYIYSARSQHFPLTFLGSLFKGHPNSAGCTLINPSIVPFS